MNLWEQSSGARLRRIWAMPGNKTLRIHEEFATAFPEIAAEYYDMKLDHFSQHA